jgi:type III restriction enzyme
MPRLPEEPLPKLLLQAYYLLGKDWQETFKAWEEAGAPTPPVMITVANRTETAARIKHAFDHGNLPLGNISELCVPELTLHIDTNTVDKDEGIREIVDTVGQRGKPGEFIRNVISVGMLSEGWDAKTVTHILGLRAFSSQLLCEQVVGRGLRRTSYDLDDGSELFTPEYVNIFGIPFTFLPHESVEGGAPKPPKPKTQIEALRDRVAYRISWPNIIRLDRVLKPELSIDIGGIDTLVLEASDTRLSAELAPIVDGKPDLLKCTEIDLQRLDAELRMQKIIFETAGQTYELMKSSWQGESTKYALFGQVLRVVEEYLTSNVIEVHPPLFNTDPLRRRIIYMMNMTRIINHLWGYIKLEQTEAVVPVFDASKKVRSTGDMPTWYTSKPCHITRNSHISHCVFDSTWEAAEAYSLDKNPNVAAWAKNDHLGFEIVYVYDGVVRRYYPDFLIRLANGRTLVLETKGQQTARDIEKRKALAEWVEAVNALGDYGEWCCDVSFDVADVDGIVARWM